MSWSLTANELIKATGAQFQSSEKVDLNHLSFSGIGTDSRKDLRGQLFIALKGDNFDAHDFLVKAKQAGAAAALVHREPSEKLDLPLFVVKDSLIGLQSLATYWRNKQNFFLMAVTGSNGKTTTKEFAQAIISSQKKSYASHGSFNNHWGVPISILSANSEHKILIQEMGMNHSGEIARLCEIAKPNVAICTMVGSSHIGKLGSQEAVAQAKEEIYIHSPEARFIFNLDNEFTRKMYERHSSKAKNVMSFSSFSEEAQVSLRADRFDSEGLHIVGHIDGEKGEALVPTFGRQNVVNIMAASCLALAAGLKPSEIWGALPLCRGTWGRNQWLTHSSGARILFDAYNANPESMQALLKNMFEFPMENGRKFLILGEMGELGEEAPEAHRKLGELAGSIMPDVIWFAGEHKIEFEAGVKASGFSKNLFLSNSYEQNLALKISSMLNQGDIAVIKGSRSMKLEQVVESWKAW